MRKHRVLAGLLTAVMLIGMIPSALAAEPAEYKGPQPGQITYEKQGAILDKTATELSARETTLNLTVSAPSDQNPVAVEFVLDGTSSLYVEDSKVQINEIAEQIRSAFAKNENVYVGITVFGRTAETVLKMIPIPDAINKDLTNVTVAWLMSGDQVGTNVQAGIRKGIEDLKTANLPENTKKYMVLVTDGGSYWWMDGSQPANNTCNGSYMQNSDAADGGYESLTPLKDISIADSAPVDYESAAGEPLADVIGQIKADGKKYTNFETGVYFAAQELNNIPDSVNLITVGRPYYADNESLTGLTSLAKEFIDEASKKDKTGLSDQLYGEDLVNALGTIADSMNVIIPAGSTITDYIGKTQSDRGETENYNFDVVTDEAFTLVVGNKTYRETLGADNTLTFDDGSTLVYTPGADEHFVLTLHDDILRGGKVSLSYTARLVEYATSSGHHDVLTNVRAYLTPANTGDGWLFPEPSLGYRVNGGGGGGGGSTIIPDDDVPLADLNQVDHYAYIIGRKDGLVHPEAQITRGEVATIYFRMLTDESREELWSQSNPYTDVQPDTWCNAAVSTMTKAGVIEGFSDGTFRPSAPITRAQFAAIAVRFFDVVYSGDDKFSDIAGHWAADYINKAAEAALINGFSDGTFRPNQYITRAQAMAIFNRVLGRAPEKDHLLPDDMITWPDNMDKSAWYYANMQEATNSHEYRMEVDSEGNPYEVWTKILPVRDWAAFEKEWATVNSAANPGEVISVPVNTK